MRIATWNVNGLRARLDFVAHWLEARRPDLVGLQELKLPDDQFPSDFFRERGYHVATHGQKSWNGVAILAREEPRVTTRGLPGQEDLGKSVDHEDFPRKLAWLDALAEHFQGVAGTPAVLCGDFNLCHEPLDSWNPDKLEGHIFHTVAERERFERLLAAGFVDVFRERHPDTQAFSWWDYRGGAFHRGQGLRIDLLLATPAAAQRVKSIEIDRDYRKKKDGLTASDHAPVFADLA